MILKPPEALMKSSKKFLFLKEAKPRGRTRGIDGVCEQLSSLYTVDSTVDLI